MTDENIDMRIGTQFRSSKNNSSCSIVDVATGESMWFAEYVSEFDGALGPISNFEYWVEKNKKIIHIIKIL
jgi:hypothetical protein